MQCLHFEEEFALSSKAVDLFRFMSLVTQIMNSIRANGLQ